MEYTVVTHEYDVIADPKVNVYMYETVEAETPEQAAGQVLASWWARIILGDIVSVKEDGEVTMRVNEEEAEIYDGKFEFVYPLPKFVELCGTEELPFRYARLFAVLAGGNLVDPFKDKD